MSEIAAPIFLLAAPFSGISYLAGQLAGHPQLYAVPELNLFLADDVAGLLDIAELDQGASFDGLLRALAELEFGAQTDANISAAQDWLNARRELVTGQVLEHLARKVSPRRLVVPASASAMRPMDLRRLHMQLPNAALMHVVRHPWTQGCLLAAWARDRLFVPPDYKDHRLSPVPAVVDPQIAWVRANANIEALQRFDGVNARRVQIEQIDADLGVLSQLLGEWLELDGGPAAQVAMTQPECWVFAGHGPRAAPYGLEAEVLEALPEADVALAEQTQLSGALPWREDGQTFAPETLAMARRYGYSPPV